jgi:hypothetical protein
MGLCHEGRTRGLTLDKNYQPEDSKNAGSEVPAKLLSLADEVIQ